MTYGKKECKIIEKKFIESKNCIMFIVDEIMFYRDGEYVCFIKCANSYPFNTYQVGDCLEIDSDRIEQEDKFSVFDTSVVKKVDSSLVATRNAMINASSINSTALAVTLEGMDRVDRNEEREFEYKMEDNSGNKHQ